MRGSLSIAGVYASCERIVSAAVKFGTLVIIGRVFGAAVVGTYTLGITVAVLVTLPLSGLEFSHNLIGTRDATAVQAARRNSLWMAGAFAIIAGPLTFWLMKELPALSSLTSADSLAVVALASLLVAESGLRGAVMALGASGYRLKFWGTGYGMIALSVFLLFSAIFSLLQDWMLIPAFAMASAMTSAYLWWSMRSRQDRAVGTGRRILKESLLEAGVASLYRGTLYLSARLDLVVVAWLLDPAHVGRYALAVGVADAATTIPKGLADLVVSEASRLRQAPSESDRLALLYRLVVIFSVVVLAATVAAAPIIVHRLFPASFHGAVPVIAVLAPGAAAVAVGRLLSNNLQASGRRALPVTANLASLSLMLVLDIVLIPAWGLVGAGLANSLSSMLLVALQAPAVTRTIGQTSKALFVPRTSDLRRIAASMRASMRPQE